MSLFTETPRSEAPQTKRKVCTSVFELLAMERMRQAINDVDSGRNDWDLELAYSRIEELGYKIGLGAIEKLALFLI